MTAAEILVIQALCAELVRPEGMIVNPNIGPDHAAIGELARTYVAAGTPVAEIAELVDEKLKREALAPRGSVIFYSFSGRYV